MSIATRVTVTTAAILLAQNRNVARAEVRMRNTGGAVVAIGGSDVTAATGFEIAAGAEESFNLDRGESLYGIVGTGSLVVEVLVL